MNLRINNFIASIRESVGSCCITWTRLG